MEHLQRHYDELIQFNLVCKGESYRNFLLSYRRSLFAASSIIIKMFAFAIDSTKSMLLLQKDASKGFKVFSSIHRLLRLSAADFNYSE